MSDNHSTELRLFEGPMDIEQSPGTSAPVNLRLQLLRNGYQPVPVVGAEFKCLSPGKMPRLYQWQSIDITPEAIHSWASGKHAIDVNTGLRTGRLVGVNIDIYDPALSEKVQKLAAFFLGDTSLYRIGLFPKCLMCYSMAIPQDKTRTERFLLPTTGDKENQIECLGNGQQFVGFGIHPVTKAEYQWRTVSPIDVPLSDLPAIDSDMLSAFMTSATAMIKAAGGWVKGKDSEQPDQPQKIHTNHTPNDPADYDEIADALAYASNHVDWDKWVAIGGAVYSALGSSGKPLFLEWSRKSSKFDEDNTNAKWDSYSRSPMIEVGKGSIFELALKSGWKSKAMLAKEERERQRAEELREHERAWGPPPDQFDEWPSEIRVAPADQAGAPVAPAPAIKEPGGEEAPKTKASKPKPETKDKPPQKPREGWAQYLQLDEKGQPVANLANVLTALRGAPELSNLMAFDAMMRQLMFKRSIAGCKIKDAKDLRAVEDAEVTALQEWLQRHDIKRVSKETVQQAVELIGRENAFHPVKDYLSGVKWDG